MREFEVNSLIVILSYSSYVPYHIKSGILALSPHPSSKYRMQTSE